MRSSAKPFAILLPILLAGVATSGAVAQDADRCSGTLCDLYYGGPPAPPQPGAKPATPQPVTVPQGGILGFFSGGKSTAAPQAAGTQGATNQGTTASAPTQHVVAIGGGGLAAMARGEAPTRCTGTLCDFYYGGPPPETPEPVAPTSGGAVAAFPQAAAAVPTEDDAASSGVRFRPIAEEPKPRCASSTQDPWKCYRK